MLEFSEWAREVILRAHAAATRLNPDARIRLIQRAGGLTPQLTDAPEPGDQVIAIGDAEILAEKDLAGLVDVEEPHDRLVLRPAGSPPSPRPG